VVKKVKNYGERKRNLFGNMAAYINQKDLGEKTLKVSNPLTMVIMGAIASIKDSRKQFFLGLELLREIIINKRLNPYSNLEEYSHLADNSRFQFEHAKVSIKEIEWDITNGGYALGSLRTNLKIGGVRNILEKLDRGDWCLVYNPDTKKAVVARKGFHVKEFFDKISKLEPNWGGPANQLFAVSPREGTKLSLRELREVLKYEF
jgi:hypothetical protein